MLDNRFIELAEKFNLNTKLAGFEYLTYLVECSKADILCYYEVLNFKFKVSKSVAERNLRYLFESSNLKGNNTKCLMECIKFMEERKRRMTVILTNGKIKLEIETIEKAEQLISNGWTIYEFRHY